ncbi:MAG: 1-phosphofructokinase family hexose kinase [Erysipelotrichaceae bacterium]|nr:1-phosphofructokinase family hexose kinase [Erysipelotrichaceae bacterium]
MIHTVTFNPTVDYFVFLNEKLEEGKIYRPYASSMKAGGKGLNISMVLDPLKIRSRAIMFLGGSVGGIIENKASEYEMIEVVKVKVDEENRINVKIRNDVETALNGAGPRVTEEQIGNLYDEIRKAEEGDYIVVSGSFCPGVDKGVVEMIGRIAAERKARLITDLPNLKIDDYRRIKPFLIKPNVEELADIFGEDVNYENYRHYAQLLLEAGVSNVIVSLGSPGGYFCNAEEEIISKGPDIEVRNTVAAGDSMLAYFIAALSNGKSFEDCLRYGESAGRSKAANEDLPEAKQVQDFYDRSEVTRIR